MLISGQRNPTAKTCVSIAKALGLQPEFVMQKAGLMPAIPGSEIEGTGESSIDLQASMLFGDLTDEEKEHVIEYMRFLTEGRGRRSTAITKPESQTE